MEMIHRKSEERTSEINQGIDLGLRGEEEAGVLEVLVEGDRPKEGGGRGRRGDVLEDDLVKEVGVREQKVGEDHVGEQLEAGVVEHNL